MQLEPRPLPSPWADKVTLIPQSVEDRGALIAILDLLAQIADNLKDRDRKIVKTSLKRGPVFHVPNIIRNSQGDYVDLHVKTFPFGRDSSLRISAIDLTVHSKLWMTIAPHEVNILAHGMMLSDTLHEITRVLKPLSAEATALLAQSADGMRLDHAFLTMIAKIISADKFVARHLSRETGDAILSSSSLKSLVRSAENLSLLPPLCRKPRIHMDRYYHCTLGAFNRDTIPPDLIPSQILDFGNFAFVESMNATSFADFSTYTEILNPFEYENYQMMDIMEAIRDFNEIKGANVQ